MKRIKLLIIICLTLLLSGCNYTELSNMGIVTLMSIKYDNNMYNITIELKENKKENEETSIIHTASDTSIEKALEQISLSIDKTLYFIDLDVLLLDENTTNQKLTSIMDYLTRDVMFGTNFNIVIDNNAEKTIKTITENKKIAGDYIKNIFDNPKNNVIDYKFDNILKNYLSEYKDLILPLGKTINNEYIINEAVIFNNKKIVNHINLDLIEAYNLLNNINYNYFYQIKYKNKTLVYRINKHNSKINYQNNKYTIDVKTNGSFIEIEDISLDDQKELSNILNILNNTIKQNIESLINTSINNESDILGLKKVYYNKQRKKINSINNIPYDIKLDINLDREGLLFNSLGDVYENK